MRGGQKKREARRFGSVSGRGRSRSRSRIRPQHVVAFQCHPSLPSSLSPNCGVDASLTHHAETETAPGDDHQAGIYDISGVISAGGREILHPGIQTRTKPSPLFSPRGKFAYGRKRSGFVLLWWCLCDAAATMRKLRTWTKIGRKFVEKESCLISLSGETELASNFQWWTKRVEAEWL